MFNCKQEEMNVINQFNKKTPSSPTSEEEIHCKCCGAKNYVFENYVFVGKLRFGKPRLTHICGTFGSQRHFPFVVKTFYSSTFCFVVHL